MNKDALTVEIYGQQYHISGASHGNIRQVASHVDEMMRKIADKNSKLDIKSLAVLSAVNIANEYLELKQVYEEMMHLIEDDQP